ncbi:dipeptide ABC transporter ATP-binding protein [Sneathiella sp. P13V-1]|uniref:ABC transporter ATP-binding protein n=1 Tax=Sneathiella sp. P13V-1 TaxID=2697366 RepID=UPI00187B1F68|nr:ABC transporter ATP-binding protein [Sneathiella sp. P13V-1]MBE7635823.1 dipeptide ABC transporter ATP-binding protein [Sneathiella sp. P13V-1]
MSNVLLVRDLKVEFRVPEGTVKAVDGVSFRVPEGKTVALVGESGSGKSVISQSIMSILPRTAHITKGEILFFDPKKPGNFYDIAKLKPDSREMREIRGGRITIIFQEPMTSLSPLHTIGDQISEALHLHHKKSKEEGRELTIDMLRLVGFPDPEAAIDTYPFELSGGLRQRAMIAMAMICHPALLIADEPTTALDVTIQAQILDLMQSLQKKLKMAILLITHDLGVVASMADEVVVMYHGKVMEQGTLEEIFDDPRHPYLKALLKAVPRFNMEEGERLTPIREIKRDEDSNFLAQANPREITGKEEKPILEVKDLTKVFPTRKSGLLGGKSAGNVKAVDQVSFFIKPGECLGLVGESGCGKTTLSKMILRAISASDGSVTYNDRGKDLDVLSLGDKELFDYRSKVQFIFQDPFSSLNPRMTVFDIISEPLVIHDIGTQKEREETVKELMRLVGLDIRFLRRYPHSFSGGQRQRIGIARALALKPDLLICDEPVSALDVSIQAQILNLLKDLQKELGLTYLFISHNLAVVDYIADRIAVMCRGRLVETAPKDVLFNNPVHPYTKRLLAAVPEPDPEHKLDFNHLVSEKASDPAAWPEPFTVSEHIHPVMLDLGEGHFVRVQEGTEISELKS